jgi:ankyrin repeat protein
MHAACADRQFKETVEAYRLRNLKVLLQNGADVNAKNNRGRSALHYAARTGLESVNKLLLEAGANPNAKDNDGKGPVDMAKESGYDDVVAILKDHGATH